MLTSKDISVIVQGAIDKQNTPLCLTSIREHLPEAEIILSTWQGSDVLGLDYDELVLNVDPGAFPYNNKPNSKMNNIDRQIVTTLNGLKLATRDYAFKLRSDFILDGCDFLSYFNQCPKSDLKYKVFEHKILSYSLFARNPRNKKHPLSFHPSDIAFLGLRSDLINLFDIPLTPKKDISFYKHKGYKYCRYAPEQYLWINCLRKNGKYVQCDYQKHCNKQIIKDTERYIVSNFIYLDYEQFNLIPPQKLLLFYKNDFEDIITNVELQSIYKCYVDSTHIVPKKDRFRNQINRKKRKLNRYKLFARLLVFLIPSKKTRQRLRKNILEYLARDLRL